MGGGGGGDVNTVTYTNLIPTYISGMQDMAVAYLTQSLALSTNNFKPYTGSTYATQNADELAGIAALVARGYSGDQLEADGETYLISLLGGNYLESNPYLDTAFQKKMDEITQSMTEVVLPSISDAYAFAFGGSEHNIEETKAAQKSMEAINDLNEKTYYESYRTERRIQNAGISHAVPYGSRATRDAEMLRTAGKFSREYLQGKYNDQWKVWNENQIIATRNVDVLGNAIRTTLGTTRTASTTFYKPSAFNDIAGLAMSGLAISKIYADSKLISYQSNKVKQDQPFRPEVPITQKVETANRFMINAPNVEAQETQSGIISDDAPQDQTDIVDGEFH